MERLYSNIKKRRKNLNMSQQELAEAVGYKGKSMIAQVENGKVDIPTSMITKFAEALNCSESDLMDDERPTAVTEPGEIMIPNLPEYISNEDQALLDQYHSVAPEVKTAIDLLLKANQPKT